MFLSGAGALGAGFTYQGQISRDSTLVDGTCDFQFSLWDSLGNATGQVGSTLPKTSVPVTNGLFTVVLDFGASAFNGEARWLKIAAKCAGDADYVALTPRQGLTPAPYALALPGLYTQQTAGTPNIIGGYSGNCVMVGVVGATIGGGGASGYLNCVTGDYGVVGGGYNNKAGAFVATTLDNPYAKINGGLPNVKYATVPGGSDNTAQGDYSFAAGRRAKANHAGAFVWADSTDADFASTANNQFLVRANGGVGINTNSPITNTLTVGGGGLRVAPDGTTLTRIQAGQTTLGNGITGVNVFTVTFPVAFSAAPHVSATPVNQPGWSYSDVFAVTIRAIYANEFVVNVYRIDVLGGSWGQSLKLDWYAWE